MRFRVILCWDWTAFLFGVEYLPGDSEYPEKVIYASLGFLSLNFVW